MQRKLVREERTRTANAPAKAQPNRSPSRLPTLADFYGGDLIKPPMDHPTAGVAGSKRGQYITHRVTLPALAADGNGYAIVFNPHYVCGNTILGNPAAGAGAPAALSTIKIYKDITTATALTGLGPVTLPGVLSGQYQTDNTYGMGTGTNRFLGAKFVLTENTTSLNLGAKIYKVDSNRALVTWAATGTPAYQWATVADLTDSRFNTITTNMNVVTGKADLRFVPHSAEEHDPRELVQWVNTLGATGATASSVQNQNILPPIGQVADEGFTKAILVFPFAAASSGVTFTLDISIWCENRRFTPGADAFETTLTVPDDRAWFSNPSVIAANVNQIAAIKDGGFDYGGMARLAAGVGGRFAPSLIKGGRSLLSRYTGGGSELAIQAGKYLVGAGVGAGAYGSVAQVDRLMNY